MQSHLLTRDEGAELLGPIAADLHACLNSAWQRWLRHPDAATASRRTRASTVYDYIAEAVELRFAGRDGISLTWRYGSLVMTVHGVALIKFKKFRGRRLRTSGISTNERQAFLAQTGVLDGMVVTHLVVGYLLDKLEQETAAIAAAAPLGQGNLWTLDLGEAFGDTGQAPLPIKVDPDTGSGPIIRSTEVAADEQSVTNPDAEE